MPAKLPTLRELFLVWLRIGCTSFGGGAVVQYLIQENFIFKHKWITPEEYARILAMCQITPGLTLIAITITIGKRLGGWRGILLSLVGLILPSATITIGMTAIYTSIRDLPPVQAALRAVFAAIFGISLATTWRNLRPLLVRNRQRDALSFITSIVILVGSAILYLGFRPPVSVLYLGGGLCGALVYGWVARRQAAGKSIEVKETQKH